MAINQRTGQSPIPDNYIEMLSNEQLLAIKKLEEFGTKLWFIRRPISQDTVTVVRCSDSTDCNYAIVELDGSLNKDHGLTIRDE